MRMRAVKPCWPGNPGWAGCCGKDCCGKDCCGKDCCGKDCCGIGCCGNPPGAAGAAELSVIETIKQKITTEQNWNGNKLKNKLKN